jgi:hypothetical protein
LRDERRSGDSSSGSESSSGSSSNGGAKDEDSPSGVEDLQGTGVGSSPSTGSESGSSASSSSSSSETTESEDPSSVEDLQGTGVGSSPEIPSGEQAETEQTSGESSDAGGSRSGGDGGSVEVQGVYVSNQGLEQRDDALGERAREAEQQVIEETPFVDDPDEVRVADDGSVQLTTEGREAQREFRREQITEEVLESNPGLTRGEVSVDLDAADGPDVDVTKRGQAQAAGLIAAPRQGGQRQIQGESIENRVADFGNAIERDEVETDVNDGIVDISVSPTGGVTTIADPQGGRRQMQEASLEAGIAERRGNATSREEVDVDLTDGDPEVNVTEPVPATARRGGGRREMQQEQIAERFARRNEDVDRNDLLVNVTSEGASVRLNDAARAERIREEVASDRENVDADEVNVSFNASGEAEVTLEESARRDALEEKAREEYPNAREIDIVENDEGELVAQITEESGVDRAVRFGQNFVDDPVGSVVEGGSDIVTGSVDATEEFVAGRARGIWNPGKTADWAVSGATDTISEAGENAQQFGAGLVEAGTNPRRTFDDTIDAVEDQPGGGVIAASVPVAAAEPTPFGEIGVGTAAVAALGAGAAYGAGQELSRRDIEELDEDQAELGVPEDPTGRQSGELTVDEDTGAVQREIPVEGISEENPEVEVPDQMDRSEIDVEDGTVRVPAELSGAFLEEQRDDEQTDEERLEELLADEEELSRREREELNELARQAQEQQLYEQEERYGEIERESVPEFRDEPISDNPSQEDIGDGIAGEASERSVDEDELIGGSTEGIERDETLPVQENFERFMESERRRLERAQQGLLQQERESEDAVSAVPEWLEEAREEATRARARARVDQSISGDGAVDGVLGREAARSESSVAEEEALSEAVESTSVEAGTEEGQTIRDQVQQEAIPNREVVEETPAESVLDQEDVTEEELQEELRMRVRNRTVNEPGFGEPLLTNTPFTPGTPGGTPNPRLRFGGGEAGGDRPEFQMDFGLRGGSDEGDLFAGWFAETVEAVATRGAGSRGAPSQSVLEEEASALGPAAQLPTAAFVSEDDETRERIEETQDLFGGGP